MPDKRKGARLRIVDGRGKGKWVKARRVEIDLGNDTRVLLGVADDDAPALELLVEGGEETLALHAEALADNAVTIRIASPERPQTRPAHGLPPTLDLTVQKALDDASKVLSPRKHQIRRWAGAALQAGAARVTIRLVDEAEGHALNREFRGKDYPTNVLTFVYEDDAQGRGRGVSGDIVLCVPVIAREAVAQGKSLEAHFAHLVVHGMLHLQGFDHEDDVGAEAMESLEAQILVMQGYLDPYA